MKLYIILYHINYMGNSQSNNSNKEKSNKLSKSIDVIATNYINTKFYRYDEFKDQYCDNLVIMTSEVIAQKLNNKEITFVQNKRHVEINEINDDNVLYMKKNKVNNLDVRTATKKKDCVWN